MTQEEIEKVKRKIPKWFRNDRQINSRILIKFLELSNKDINPVSKKKLEEACRDINFTGNYNQMKNVGENNHAQVFYENNGYISLQHDKEVREFILEEYEKILFVNSKIL